MAPIDALRSATSVDADLLGVSQKLGTLEKGKAGRHRRDAGRSDARYHRDGTRFVRDEGRKDHSQRSGDADADGCCE